VSTELCRRCFLSDLFKVLVKVLVLIGCCTLKVRLEKIATGRYPNFPYKVFIPLLSRAIVLASGLFFMDVNLSSMNRLKLSG
jgi:hypothetical protein